MKKFIVVVIIVLLIFGLSFMFGKYFIKNAEESSDNSNLSENTVDDTTSKDNTHNYIIEKSEMETSGLYTLFTPEEFIMNADVDLMQTDMTYVSSCNLYYKIINNMDDYEKFSSRIGLPEMTKSDFDEKFLVVVSNESERNAEIDLTIYDVYADETTTHIVMKQKDNSETGSSQYSQANVFYAVVDISQLKDSADLVIDYD